jgi:aspartyl aminopeptidase
VSYASSQETVAARELAAYIDASPSPFHAVAEASARLDAAGFTRLDETAAWPSGVEAGYVTRGGALVAWRGGTPLGTFRIVGAHTDSPNLRIKPQPDMGNAGIQQLGIEVYGGVLLNSWLDRDLGLSGRVLVRERGPVLVKVDRPVLRVPQLAIHLDRDIVATGLTLNAQQHLNPVWAIGAPDRGAFARFLAKEIEVDEGDVLGWDVMCHDLTPAARLGRDDELLSAPRLDDLCSAWCGLTALVDATPPADTVAVVSLFDHEEVGSESDRGAGGPLLANVLERVVLAGGGDREAFHRALAGSICVSADMAHATHPNYADRHEPGHWVQLGGGPVVKSNVNQRYATEAEGAVVFTDACERAGVPVQRYVHRNDLPCGSTIGPITSARLGITTVDVGAPQLSMHSARELMAAVDVDYFLAALTAFLT